MVSGSWHAVTNSQHVQTSGYNTERNPKTNVLVIDTGKNKHTRARDVLINREEQADTGKVKNKRTQARRHAGPVAQDTRIL